MVTRDGAHLELRNLDDQPLYLERLVVDGESREVSAIIGQGEALTLNLENPDAVAVINMRVAVRLDIIVPRNHALIRHRAERYNPDTIFDVGLRLMRGDGDKREIERLRQVLKYDQFDAVSAAKLGEVLLRHAEFTEARYWLQQAQQNAQRLPDGGVLIIALIAVAVSALFQLPTFTWMLRTALILCLVATPLIFQPELRRGLERLGRTLGFLQIRPTELSHRVVPALVRVASDLSERQIGALIILEGTTALNDVISTGVQLNAHLSPDLLETIFQNKSPLHDGAVVIREDEIVAAAAVLPLSEQPLPDGMHQGTRHRAALGISEQSDSLALVVSEENGYISVAQNGRLNRDLDATELRDTLYRFYIPLQASSSGLRGLLTAKLSFSGRNGKVTRRTRVGQILRSVTTAVLAVMLAIATWLLVAEQVNPAKTEVMTEIPLRLSNENKELLLVSNLPTTVSAVVQAPQDIMANLSAQSFRATADLSGLSADVHRVPVNVRANDERVRVVSVDPTAIDVELQLKATQPMTVEVVVSDRDTLPFSYEISGAPSAQPSQVTVTGPADVMQNLARTEVVIPLRGARSTVQEDRTVLFLSLIHI